VTITICRDTITVIREHPGMYIAVDSRPLAARLLLRLIIDAVALNVSDLSVERCGQWVLLGSSTDWLHLGQFQFDSPLELFRRAVAFPELGTNSVRGEVVVRALASKVVVYGSEGLEFLEPYGVADTDPVIGDACKRMNKRRVVGFVVDAG
jgi:hypothetical protein